MSPLVVTPELKIGVVLARYGDIAEVMETFGVKRVGRFDLRRFVGRWLSVRQAAKIHKRSTSEMVRILQTAINQVHADQERASPENRSSLTVAANGRKTTNKPRRHYRQA